MYIFPGEGVFFSAGSLPFLHDSVVFREEFANSSRKKWIILFFGLIISSLIQIRRILYEKETSKSVDNVSRSSQTAPRWVKTGADSQGTGYRQKNSKEVP
jgi:hypothetical protein